MASQYTEVSSALGFFCGSNDCSFMAGPANQQDSQAARTKIEGWCR